MIFPVIVLSARPVAYITRVTFVTLGAIFFEDYIRTANAKGLSHRQVVNAQTGTAYTVANADKAKTIIRNNGGASTQDWPQDSAATSLAIGTIIRTFNRGAGAVTHQAGTGATVLVTGTQGQHTWWTAQKIAANTWAVGPG